MMKVVGKNEFFCINKYVFVIIIFRLSRIFLLYVVMIIGIFLVCICCFNYVLIFFLNMKEIYFIFCFFLRFNF